MRDFIGEYIEGLLVTIFCVVMVALSVISVKFNKDTAFVASLFLYLPPIPIAWFHNYYRKNWVPGSATYNAFQTWWIIFIFLWFIILACYQYFSGGVIS